MTDGYYFWLGASAPAETGHSAEPEPIVSALPGECPARVMAVLEKHADEVRIGFVLDLMNALGLRLKVAA